MEELSRKQEMEAYIDALGAIVIALGYQIDPIRLYADLKALANQAEHNGRGPSAGAIDELARAVQHVHLKERPKH